MRPERSWKHLRRINGLYWPDSDRVAYQIISNEVGFLDEAIKHSHRTIAIQAGGNAGIYPLYLADRFSHVVTFEPDAENFECLAMNITSNITAIQGALGESEEEVGIRKCVENSGAHQVDVKGSGVLMYSIDGLGIDPDFIQLDIEGFEYYALKGAESTIKRCKPIIMIEDINHGDRFGHNKTSVHTLLKSLGYEMIGGNRTDTIWRYQTIQT